MQRRPVVVMLPRMHGPPTPVIPLAARLIGATFGFVFAGIGFTVLGFLWFSDDGFGAPPLFFRLFGSFIAIAFVVFGGTMGLSALTAQARLTANSRSATTPTATPPPPPANPTRATGPYACPHCGAALTSHTEASPHGDIKCPFCGAWFNIHRRPA